MGFTTERSVREQNRFIGILDQVFANARHFYWTDETIRQELKQKVFTNAIWLKLSAAAQAYVMGYWEAKRKDIWLHQVEWALHIDGKLMTSAQARALDKAERDAAGGKDYQHPYCKERLNADLCVHVWKDANGNPRLDKPFNPKVTEKKEVAA